MDKGMMENKLITEEEIIELLGLVPLEGEGGLVAETWRSKVMTQDGETAGTSIFYFLRGQAFSHLHRLTGDEMYHFYLGDAVEMLELLPGGGVKKTVLGSDILHGEKLQHLVPAGNWQGSRLAAGGRWALLGTTMCPGYSQAGYEHGDADALIEAWPSEEANIRQLTGRALY